jgi:hypothetical protein
MIYLYKLITEWALEYPTSAAVVDLLITILVIVISVDALSRSYLTSR